MSIRVPGRQRPRVDTSEHDAPATHGLIEALDASERFRRDGRLGAIFHPGRISFREVKRRDSLHIVIDGSHVSAHVDEICPLTRRADGEVTYSWVRVVVHNMSGLMADIRRRVRGVHGQQRCNLGCEMVWVDEDEVADFTADLQSGGSSGPGPCTEPTG